MFQREYGFDVSVDSATNSISYKCEMCGRSEHGGGVPNPGLYARMKQHLRENHRLPTPDNLKREDVVRGRDLVKVWFGYDDSDQLS
jgi:hypothetical protein